MADYSYKTTKELEESQIRNAKYQKNHENFHDAVELTAQKRAMPIIINNVEYDSLNHASRALSINLGALKKAYKDIQSTSLSSFEREMRITKTFTFQKKLRES